MREVLEKLVLRRGDRRRPLREQGRAVDIEGFEAAMAEQRARARAAWAGSGEAATERVWFEIRERTGASEFLGYSTENAEGEIVALVVDGKPVAEAAAGTVRSGTVAMRARRQTARICRRYSSRSSVSIRTSKAAGARLGPLRIRWAAELTSATTWEGRR